MQRRFVDCVRRAARTALRHTAELAGIDASHLQRVERGEAGLSIDSLQRLAAVLGPDELAQMLAPSADQPGADPPASRQGGGRDLEPPAADEGRRGSGALHT